MRYVVGWLRLAGFLALTAIYALMFFLDRLVVKLGEWWRWPPKV